jgi:hypothetical protein
MCIDFPPLKRRAIFNRPCGRTPRLQNERRLKP